MKIFSWALIITIISWIFLKQDFIVFGVLHFIGIAVILAYPLIRYRFMNIFLGVIIIITGIYIQSFRFDFPWLLWIGLIPQYFQTVDYFPIFPWFGLILIGIFIGNTLYHNYERHFKIHDISSLPLTRFFGFLGKHSLLIYLTHQPILIALMYTIGIMNIDFLILF